MNNKIRILVADNNQETTNEIVNSIKEMEDVEIVGTAIDGIDTYNKIIELQPEMVFSKYDYGDMKGLELIKKAKEKLQDKFPNFSSIGEIPKEELMQVIKITGDKLNARIIPPHYNAVKDIVIAYKELKK